MYLEIINFFTSSATHFSKFRFLFDAEVAAAYEVGGDACGRRACEGVEHPGVLVGRGEDDAGEQCERLLCRVLAARLFPRGDGRQSPYVSHLLVVVQLLHQFVIESMGTLSALACPNDELGRIGEVAAGNIGRRIRFCPRHDIKNLKAQLGEAIGNGEDVVVGAGNPDGTVVLQLIAAEAYPALVEVVDFLGCATMIPFTLVDRDYFASRR